MNRADLQNLAALRVQEAKLLLNGGFHAGAYYLAGYALECALKACIAKQTKEHDFPDKRIVDKSYTHSLETLIEVAGLKKELDDEIQSNGMFSKYWNVVKDWKESVRYEAGITEKRAADLYLAIDDAKHGVLQWLKKWW